MQCGEIIEYAKNAEETKQAWFGLNPQFNMDIIDIEKSTNFRVDSNFHGQYDKVWIFEKMLNEYNPYSWKIIVDEAIRLIKKEGLLIVKLRETQHLTKAMLKSFIFRNINLEVSIDYQNCENDTYCIVFKIVRKNFEIYQDKSWTFAMLTSGNSDDVVIKFLKSIRNNEKTKSQIIISGPQKDIYDEYDVEYIDLSQFRDELYPEISRKKNAIAAMAKNANILIAHDRYYLDDNFFVNFEKYGYDFDFIALKQLCEDGDQYPFYCFLYRPILSYTHPVRCDCFEHIFDTQYVNGGLMIFKTETLKQVKFNELCFWGEFEDVEITQEFMTKSLIPRVNYISQAIAVNKKRFARDDSYKQFDVYNGCNIKSFVNHTNIGNFYLINCIDKVHMFKIGSYSLSFRIRKKSTFPFVSVRIKIFSNY